MSRDEGKLLDEDVFPHTYNPSTNLLEVVFRSERTQKESLDLVIEIQIWPVLNLKYQTCFMSADLSI
jgi:hypothetical protein